MKARTTRTITIVYKLKTGIYGSIGSYGTTHFHLVTNQAVGINGISVFEEDTGAQLSAASGLNYFLGNIYITHIFIYPP